MTYPKKKKQKQKKYQNGGAFLSMVSDTIIFAHRANIFYLKNNNKYFPSLSVKQICSFNHFDFFFVKKKFAVLLLDFRYFLLNSQKQTEQRSLEGE